jgi:hypothetical protein
MDADGRVVCRKSQYFGMPWLMVVILGETAPRPSTHEA